MEFKKSVDESWKESVEHEKAQEHKPHPPTSAGPQSDNQDKAPFQESPASSTSSEPEMEFNFMSYITSLAVQAMIFLGELPNPMANHQMEVNLKQTKLLIDTLLILRDKTEGNRTKEEDDFLTGALYELQMKYVEKVNADKGPGRPS